MISRTIHKLPFAPRGNPFAWRARGGAGRAQSLCAQESNSRSMRVPDWLAFLNIELERQWKSPSVPLRLKAKRGEDTRRKTKGQDRGSPPFDHDDILIQGLRLSGDDEACLIDPRM